MKYLKNSRLREITGAMPLMIVSLTLILMLLLSGCSGVKYNLLFPSIDGLKKGGKVLFEENSIGLVNKIVYTEQGEYLVSISVDDAFAAAMTEYSRFEIVYSSTDNSEKIIVMTQEEKGGIPLEKESTIKAVEPSPFSSLKKMTPMLKKMESGFDDFIKEKPLKLLGIKLMKLGGR